jgi:hypothetical protein
MCPQVIGISHDQGPGLIDGLDPLRAGGALGDHQRPDRRGLAVSSFGVSAARPERSTSTTRIPAAVMCQGSPAP